MPAADRPGNEAPRTGLIDRIFRGRPMARVATGAIAGALVLGGAAGAGAALLQGGGTDSPRDQIERGADVSTTTPAIVGLDATSSTSTPSTPSTDSIPPATVEDRVGDNAGPGSTRHDGVEDQNDDHGADDVNDDHSGPNRGPGSGDDSGSDDSGHDGGGHGSDD